MGAETPNSVDAGSAETGRLDAGEHFLGDPYEFRSMLANRGVDFQVVYVSEVLANVAGGLQCGAVYSGLLRLALDLDMQKLGILSNAQWHVSGLYPHGRSASENYLGDLFTFSNIDAVSGPRLFEFWYQQGFWNERLSLRAGQLAADEEFAYTEYGGMFVNGAYGWPVPIALNVPSPAYPVATPGVRLQVKLTENWAVRAALYNGNPYPLDPQGKPLNAEGIYFRIRESLALAEAQWEWNTEPGSGRLPGTVKFGSWFHSGVFLDPRFDHTGRSLAHPASTGQPRPIRGNWGLFLTAEQQVWREERDNPDQGIGVFTRVAGTPANGNLIDLYLEAGASYTGLIPGRDRDAVGLAIVYGRISRGVRLLAADTNLYQRRQDPLPDFEVAVEGTYNALIRGGLAIQPVVGYVAHPGGISGKDALVLGVRASLDF